MSKAYIYTLLFSLFAFRMLVVIFHEFGHAFATLLNTDGDVSVYIGSYGNPEKSFRFKIKRLECFIKYNIFTWKGGLCVPHGENISWKSRILITLFGPVTTLIIGSIACVSFLFFETYSLPNILLFAIAFSCFLDFILNIIPWKTQIKLHNGSLANNDGRQLIHLWNIRKVYSSYTKASNHYMAKEYQEAAELFEECMDVDAKNRDVHRLTIASYLSGKDYEKAIALQEKYTEIYEDTFDIQDLVSIGVIEIHRENYTKALALFEEALELNPKNNIILNNCGYVLGLLEKYDEAIVHLDKAIVTDETFGYAWNNRGYCKIMLDQFEEGHADLQKALELDDQNSYVYFYLGIYHFKKNDYQKALEFYQKAHSLDPQTHKIQEYIDEVKQFI